MQFQGKLTEAIVATVTKPGKYHDGQHGLFLRVRSTGGRHFCQRIAVRGKRVELGLGGWPLVTLEEARDRALANRRVARAGGDPRSPLAPVARDGLPLVGRDEPPLRPPAPTFAEAAAEVIRINAAGWKNGGRSESIWRSSLEAHAMPLLGDMRVNEIGVDHLTQVLEPIWNETPETARRLRQRLNSIMQWSIALGHRKDNPVEALKWTLPRGNPAPKHFRSLHHSLVGGAVQRVLESRAWAGTRLAFTFLVLTAARSGEVRNAAPSEIDHVNSIWTVPASRTKTGRRHRVPLADRAVLLLDRSRLDMAPGLLFPSQFGKPMSDATMSKLLRELGIDAVPHGFRSSFRDWASEVEEAPREVAELCLAHVPYGSVESAYARSDLLERRRTLMQAWSDYLTATGLSIKDGLP